MTQGIISGNQNKIPPELDAIYRDIVMGRSGHNLNLTYNATNQTITVNGIVIAYGVVGYFKNTVISDVIANGYVYVDLTTHQDEDVEDEANAFFSASMQTETHPNIALNAGTYRMRVANVSNGVIARNETIESPEYAMEADIAEVVTGTIAANAKGVTAETSNRSSRVATTEFVHNAIESQMQSGQLGSFHQNISSQTSTVLKRLGLVAIRLEFTVSGSVFSDGIPTGQTIAVIPEWARPSQSVIKTTADNRTFSIGTNGSIVETTSGSSGYVGGSSNIIDFWYLA